MVSTLVSVPLVIYEMLEMDRESGNPTRVQVLLSLLFEQDVQHMYSNLPERRIIMELFGFFPQWKFAVFGDMTFETRWVMDPYNAPS